MRTSRPDALRYAIIGVTITLATNIAPPCHAAPAAVYITPADVNAVISQLSPIYTDDEPLHVIDAGAYHVGVFVVGRPKTKAAEPPSLDGAVPVMEGLSLPNVTAIVTILKGHGAFVTGGALVDPIAIAVDDPDLAVIGPGFRSKAIRGGAVRQVKGGDRIIIPAGVPHGFSAIDAPLVYEVVRIDAAKVLPLK